MSEKEKLFEQYYTFLGKYYLSIWRISGEAIWMIRITISCSERVSGYAEFLSKKAGWLHLVNMYEMDVAALFTESEEEPSQEELSQAVAKYEAKLLELAENLLQ